MAGYQTIAKIIGFLLIILGILMIVPMLCDYFTEDNDWKAFFKGAAISLFFGGGLLCGSYGHKESISTRQIFILVNLIWLVIPLFAAIPLYLHSYKLSMTNAFFEAVSGVTSCGATIMHGLDYASNGILIWRAILNWIGGIGIVVVAMSILPALKIGGMQLFKAESSDEYEKLLPRAKQFASAIFGVYIFATLISVGMLWMTGISFFDAVCHAFAAIATGGFSTHDDSIGYFNNLSLEIVMTIIMIFSCLPYTLYIQLVKGKAEPLLRDTQVHWSLIVLFTSIATSTFWLYYYNGFGFTEALRFSSFNLTSVITTSGFSQSNYVFWGSYPIFLILLLSQIGGCTGSTAGGIKLFRFQILYEMLKAHLNKIIHPHGVFKPHFNNKPINETIIASVSVYFFIYIAMFMILVMLLSIDGVNLITSIRAVGTTISATGYSIGDIYNPETSYANLPDFSKWVLSFTMVVGRLEFLTVLVLFLPSFWKIN